MADPPAPQLQQAAGAAPTGRTRPALRAPARGPSLRRRLLAGILLPVLGFVVLNTASLYRQALDAADTAYDRTLLASAKSIGELLEVVEADPPQLRSNLAYSALEAFEADNRSRMFFRVTGFAGERVSGFDDLPPPRPASGPPSVYAALVHFYDDQHRGEPVRMAVLLQPVAGQAGQGMATIQVAETLELRRMLARQLLWQTLWQQALLLALIALVVVAVVQRATRPVLALSQTLRQRSETDLSPLPVERAPRELLPVLEAMNAVMARLAHLLEHQKRFVRDTSHQLRTPLAVLKAQVQSARRGDVEAMQALAEIDGTVDRATQLANQMLALAKVEQLRQQGLQGDAPVHDWAAIVRAVALDLSALIGQACLEFELQEAGAGSLPVRAHEWALRELTRNLLHNAIRHSPAGGSLALRLRRDGAWAELTVADAGPGIAPGQRARLFQPFASGLSGPPRPAAARVAEAVAGPSTGLGLAICHEIVVSLGGRIDLLNRQAGEAVAGLDAVVRLPLGSSAALPAAAGDDRGLASTR